MHEELRPADWSLVHGTARTLLDAGGGVEDGSVGMVLTDPPYVISRDTGFRKKTASGDFGGNASFAITMDYGVWDTEQGFSLDDLRESVEGMARVLRPGGVAVVFFDIWKISTLMSMMTAAGLERTCMLEWVKTNAVPINARSFYLSNAREVAAVAVKPGAEPTSTDPDNRGLLRAPIYAGHDRWHPTQKSLPLFERLIRAHTGPGETVLDCFAGSATTGAAAIRTGRRFIGSEPDPAYHAKATERLALLSRHRQP